MFGWFAYLWLSPGPARYHYKMTEEGGIESSASSDSMPGLTLSISRQEIVVEGVERTSADAYLARRGNTKPGMLAWENHLDEQIIFVDSKLSERTILAPAIAKHMPKDAVILAWWATPRQIQPSTGLETVSTSHLSEPLITPSFLATANRGDRIRTPVLGLYGKWRREGEIATLPDEALAEPQRVLRCCVN